MVQPQTTLLQPIPKVISKTSLLPSPCCMNEIPDAAQILSCMLHWMRREDRCSVGPAGLSEPCLVSDDKCSSKDWSLVLYPMKKCSRKCWPLLCSALLFDPRGGAEPQPSSASQLCWLLLCSALQSSLDKERNHNPPQLHNHEILFLSPPTG
jgi:hypothetical protein